MRAASPLHAVLPCDGVAVLRVVQKRHVDSNQRRPVSCEDLTPDDRHQAAWTNTKKARVNKQCQPASTRSRGVNTANNCQPFAAETSKEARFTDIQTHTHTHAHQWLLVMEMPPRRTPLPLHLLRLKPHNSLRRHLPDIER